LVEELVFLRIIPVDEKVSDSEELRDFVKRRLTGARRILLLVEEG
jgi:hypothetical protein